MHAHGGDYARRLAAHGTSVQVEVVAGMGHQVTRSAAGLAALRHAVLAPRATTVPADGDGYGAATAVASSSSGSDPLRGAP